MKITRRLIFILILFSVPSFIFSQGFTWTEELEEEFNKIPELGVTRSSFPSSASLLKYIPFAYNQGNTGMCAAYSLSACRTILYNRNKKITDHNLLLENKFSPFFIYSISMRKGDNECSKGLYPSEALFRLKKYGVPKLEDVEGPNYYPFTDDRLLCNAYPGDFEKDLLKAYQYRIDRYHRVENEKQVKQSIVSGNPIYFGFKYMPEFLSLYSKEDIDMIFKYRLLRKMTNIKNKDFWDPNALMTCLYYDEKANKFACSRKIKSIFPLCSYHQPQDMPPKIGHAMCLIGYDDNKYGGSFLILNSWGEDWADDGKIWIQYDDFFEYMRIAASIEIKNETSRYAVSPKEGDIEFPDHINIDIDSKKPYSTKVVKSSTSYIKYLDK